MGVGGGREGQDGPIYETHIGSARNIGSVGECAAVRAQRGDLRWCSDRVSRLGDSEQFQNSSLSRLIVVPPPSISAFTLERTTAAAARWRWRWLQRRLPRRRRLLMGVLLLLVARVHACPAYIRRGRADGAARGRMVK